jgi:hypothetical protein
MAALGLEFLPPGQRLRSLPDGRPSYGEVGAVVRAVTYGEAQGGKLKLAARSIFVDNYDARVSASIRQLAERPRTT